MEPCLKSQNDVDATRWQAVVNRDKSADGDFFFAVKTTGVYCRPSCPARWPKRENVQFFRSSADALKKGYRPCKRCRPNDVAVDEALAASVRAIIDADPDHRASLSSLSQATGVSSFHLQRVFKRATGMSPREYAAAARAERLKLHLKSGEPVTAAAFDAGYGSTSRLYEAASRELGMTPSQYRSGGKGLAIEYALGGCSLGAVLVAATGKGICAVWLGNTNEELVVKLGEEYPAAELHEAERLQETVCQLADHLVDGRPFDDLPLDVKGTDFQWQVWRRLQEIPRGQTRSYTQIAEEIGRPAAVRAVAQACAGNQVALVIPCHRVVRGDGSLSGYRWGPERKRKLLEAERENRR